ncbi:glycosyltransferase family 61 protein [Celeribacter sp. SCSIO 80788]|jgi:capsular polysaccharide biosynthesis protein|uniref:glycosyltransferase family 61 protein n=1 Tax=Celeribacter sp. SCSIO 80788 TaxID=3117013 RepID=UPI003DA4EBAE
MSAYDQMLNVTQTHLTEARIVPPLREGAFRHMAGVFDKTGAFCAAANIKRGEDYLLGTKNLRETPDKRLPGRHLYGGQMNHHFGHFLCETLSRLWALDHLDAAVDSILFLSRRPNAPQELQAFQTAMFDALNLSVPIRIVSEPLIVDELIVPTQGFGIDELGEGAPEFRDYIHRNFLPEVAPEGPENLYISRQGLSLRAGAALGEDALSENLRNAGYEEFFPEKHDIATQVARYKAAKNIVSIEGSALHLYGFVGHKAQSAAVIVRRSDMLAANMIAAQLRSFCEITPQVLNAVTREWDITEGPVRSSKSISLLDIPQLGRALAQAGMVEDRPWPAAKGNFDRRIERITGKTNRDYREVPLQTAPAHG